MRRAFLLSLEGLGLFLVLPGMFEAGPLSLASREKEKEEPILREKLKAKPWPASVWQRSRHLADKEESISPTAVTVLLSRPSKDGFARLDGRLGIIARVTPVFL